MKTWKQQDLCYIIYKNVTYVKWSNVRDYRDVEWFIRLYDDIST